MDFSKTDIMNILKVSLGNRFEDFNPNDFEDFIAQLFKDNEYEVKQTQYSGDYGADLIINKDNQKTVVQVKRYSPTTKVGVKDINQLLGSKAFYKCSKSLIITTSSFTIQAKHLAQETGVELWDWGNLYQFICKTYLGGKDHFEFFNTQKNISAEDFEIIIKKIEKDVPMKGNFTANLVYIDIKNNTNKHQELILNKPIIITADNRQVEANAHLTGFFAGGKIYSGCSVEACFVFDKAILPSISTGDKFIIEFHKNSKKYTKSAIFTTSIPMISSGFYQEPEKSYCFIATAVYGTPMVREIDILREWRDNTLNKTYYGRRFVSVYYKISPPIADLISKKEKIRKIIRIFLTSLIKIIRGENDL